MKMAKPSFLILLLVIVVPVAAQSVIRDSVRYDSPDGKFTSLFDLDETQRMLLNTTDARVTDANYRDAVIQALDKTSAHNVFDEKQVDDNLERLYLSDNSIDTTYYMTVWRNDGTSIERSTEVFFPKHTQRLQLLEWQGGKAVFTTAGGSDIQGSGNAYIYVGGTEYKYATVVKEVGVFTVTLPDVYSHVGENIMILWMNDDASNGNQDICLYDGTIPYLSCAPNSNPPSTMPSEKVDIVVVEGSPLTISSATTKGNIIVNPGGKLTISAAVVVDSIILRADARNDKYPQMYVADGGSIKDKNGNLAKVYYDYELDAENMYTFATPGTVSLSDIRFFNICEKNSGTGAKPTLDRDYYIDAYDGQKRADDGKGGFYYFGGTTLSAKTGYTIAAEPQLWGTQQRKSTILRIPMTYSAPAKANITLKEYASTSTSTREHGWNFIGNPFYTSVDGAGTISGAGVLRYYTVPSNVGVYEQVKAADFEILPFHAFFVQSPADGTLSFAKSQQALRAPAAKDESKEYSIGVALSTDDLYDKTEMLIGDAFDDTYELNADLVKWDDSRELRVYTLLGSTKLAYHATSPLLAQMPIAVGYRVSQLEPLTFSALEMGDNEHFAALYLYDDVEGVTTNLFEEDYTFTPTEKENNSRFTISCVAADKTPTDVDEVGDGVLFSVSKDGLTLYEMPSDAVVRVYDIMGHLVADHVDGHVALASGVYIIQVSGAQTQVQPILIP